MLRFLLLDNAEIKKNRVLVPVEQSFSDVTTVPGFTAPAEL